MHISESPRLQRSDAACSLAFLSACAAALSEQKLLSEMDADALRLRLKEGHRNSERTETSLFAGLVAESAPLIQLLQARCGASGLSQLFIAWTAGPALESTSKNLEQWSGSLLKKAELLFNQDFYIFQEDRCERRTLFSSYLIDIAEQLHEQATQIQSLAAQLQFVTPHSPRSSETGQAWEESLSRHLGFRYDDGGYSGLDRLQEVMKRLHMQFEILSDRIRQFSYQLARNTNNLESLDHWQLLLEDSRNLLLQMKSFELSQIGSLERMEKKRIRLLSCLQSYGDLLEGQEEACLEMLKIGCLQSQRLSLWPEVEKRELLINLVVQNVPLRSAQEAISTLEQYCTQHGVAAHQLLASELSLVHAHLHAGILPILQNLAKDKQLGSDSQQEKQSVLKRKDRLMQILGNSLVLMLASSLWPGCGIKTAPRSEFLDLRPSVPYHAEQGARSPVKADEKTPPKK